MHSCERLAEGAGSTLRQAFRTPPRQESSRWSCHEAEVVLDNRLSVEMGCTPEVKCSMMAAKISGLSTLQTYCSLLVTVTKSEPKKTPVTPSIANRRFASGELSPSLADSKLLDPLCTTITASNDILYDSLVDAAALKSASASSDASRRAQSA